jgi:hypothetical protein
LEYVFETGEQNSPNAVTKEKAAEIAADFMTVPSPFNGGCKTLAVSLKKNSGI